MLKVHVAGVLVVNSKGEILLLFRHKEEIEGGTWGIPGGTVEGKENPSDTALREIKEETGLNCQSGDLIYKSNLSWILPWKGEEYDINFEYFTLKLKGTNKIILDKKESIRYLWVKPKNAYKRHDLMKGLYIVLEDYLNLPHKSRK